MIAILFLRISDNFGFSRRYTFFVVYLRYSDNQTKRPAIVFRITRNVVLKGSDRYRNRSPNFIQPFGGSSARLRPRCAGPTLSAGNEGPPEAIMYLPISLGTVLLILIVVWLVR